MALGVGFVGTLLANLPARSDANAESLVSMMRPSEEITGSIAPAGAHPAAAIRLIDLRNGASCKMAGPADPSAGFRRAPLGPECAASPELARVAYWKTTGDGSLVMADGGGATVLEFIPGDGVLYESVYPSNALITIVPARG
ncbi:hypothetical protein D3218_06530 [Aureimonas flava]|uniref:Alkaline proteinase inhibitor/ Outer membrane lipoprotein Omp19 domain-containing protein n=1 Tax=Aureimonas flava TaxID=2320271 RepID=A0A3A1WM87_9HYPH|nr:hypothetical protein D3218_06530 [Aureimonas flava]